MLSVESQSHGRGELSQLLLILDVEPFLPDQVVEEDLIDVVLLG